MKFYIIKTVVGEGGKKREWERREKNKWSEEFKWGKRMGVSA